MKRNQVHTEQNERPPHWTCFKRSLTALATDHGVSSSQEPLPISAATEEGLGDGEEEASRKEIDGR